MHPPCQFDSALALDGKDIPNLLGLFSQHSFLTYPAVVVLPPHC